MSLQEPENKETGYRHPFLPFYHWFWKVLMGLGNRDEISLMPF
jgi:hypothetical protein